MGLFGGSRKLCPICGKPAARLLPTKVGGQPLCGECAGKAAQLPRNFDVSSMAVETFREFVAYYNDNASLRSAFQESYQYSFGIFGGAISLDVPHSLLRFDTADNAVVFEASSLRSFCILEDAAPLFEGTRDALICHQSAVPARVRGMGPEISRFLMEQRQYEQMERMNEMLEKQARDAGKSYSPTYCPAPDIDRLKPFEKIYLKIEMDQPYWSGCQYAQGAPGFSTIDPTIAGYLRDYEAQAERLRELAGQLMHILNPSAPERQADTQAAPGMYAAPAASSAPTDVVAEIQKYKALLDSGVITEAEFTAKKRQLMGI